MLFAEPGLCDPVALIARVVSNRNPREIINLKALQSEQAWSWEMKLRISSTRTTALIAAVLMVTFGLVQVGQWNLFPAPAGRSGLILHPHAGGRFR